MSSASLNVKDTTVPSDQTEKIVCKLREAAHRPTPGSKTGELPPSTLSAWLGYGTPAHNLVSDYVPNGIRRKGCGYLEGLTDEERRMFLLFIAHAVEDEGRAPAVGVASRVPAPVTKAQAGLYKKFNNSTRKAAMLHAQEVAEAMRAALDTLGLL